MRVTLRRLNIIALYFLLVIGVTTVLWPLITTVVNGAKLGGLGDLRGVAFSLLNSILLSTLVASLNALLLFKLIISKRYFYITLLVSLVFLFSPPETTALGYDYLSANLIDFGLNEYFVNSAALILCLMGFTFPYMAMAFYFMSLEISDNQVFASQEYTTSFTKSEVLLLWTSKEAVVMSACVGILVALNESVRVRILQTDVFGLGSQFYGNKLDSAFTSRNIDAIFWVFSGLSAIMFFFAIVKVLQKPAT